MVGSLEAPLKKVSLCIDSLLAARVSESDTTGRIDASVHRLQWHPVRLSDVSTCQLSPCHFPLIPDAVWSLRDNQPSSEYSLMLPRSSATLRHDVVWLSCMHPKERSTDYRKLRLPLQTHRIWALQYAARIARKAFPAHHSICSLHILIHVALVCIGMSV